MITLTEEIDAFEGFAGISALVSGMTGLTVFGLDSVDPVVRMIGLSLAMGTIPLGAYHSYNGLFRDTDSTST